MVLAWQGDKACAWNSKRQFPTRLERLHLIPTYMHYKRRHFDLGQQVGHIKIPRRLKIAIGALGTRCFALPLGKLLELLSSPCGHEQ